MKVCLAMIALAANGVIASAATLNTDRTSVDGLVQSGAAVNTISDTHYLQVPGGMYATVTMEEGKFSWHHCDSASFRAYIGSTRLEPGVAVEVEEDATISVSMTCVAGRWCNPYNIVGYTSVAGVRFPKYYPSYHYYTDNWARQSYSIRVRFTRKAPDLSVSAIALSASAVAIDESATLSFTIRNGGRLDAGAATVVRVFDGTGQLGGDIAVPALAVGAASNHSVSLPRLSSGNHTIRVVSDATGRVDEANEANNSAEASLRVYRRTPVAVTFRLNFDGGDDTVLPIVAGNLIGTLLTVTRRGYDFCGWWSDAIGGVQIGPTEKITESRTFYAHWNAHVSTVVLNRQGGSGGTRTTSATFDADMVHISPPTREGYVFGGFFTEPSGNGVQYYSAGGDGLRTWDIDCDAVLYAKWTGVASTITLDRREGTGGSSSVAAKYGEPPPSIEPPMRLGWIFQGYFAEADGGGRQHFGSDGSATCAWNSVDDVTLYAHWLPVKMEHIISLDAQGGEGGEMSISVTYGVLMSAITPPVKPHHAFKGFYSQPGGQGTRYYNADGTAATALDVIDLETLYAWWEPAYGVVLDPNGATGNVVTNYFTLVDWTLANNTFTSNGCMFAGWATKPGGAPVYPDGATLTAELLGYNGEAASQKPATLYAKWGKPLKASLFPGCSFVTGGDGDCCWFEENGELRSTRKAGLSWLTVEIEERGEFVHSATNAAFSLFSAYEVYTNNVNGKVTHNLSPRRHLAVWSVEKGMLTLYGAIEPTEDYDEISVLVEQRETELESKVQEFSSLVYDVLLSRNSTLTEGYCRKRVDEVVEAWLQNRTCSGYVYFNSTPVASFANDVMTKFSRLGNNVYPLNRALESSSLGVNDCAVEIMNAISDINAIVHWRDFHAALTEMRVRPRRLVAFAGEEPEGFRYMLDAVDGIERCERLCFEYAKPLIENVIEYLVAGNSWIGFGGAEAWEGVIRESLSDLIQGEVTASDGTKTRNFYSDLKKRLFYSGYNTSHLEYAVDPAYYWKNSAYAIWLFNRVQRVIDEIAALQACIVDSGVDEWRLVDAHEAIGELPELASREGYSFLGWFPADGIGKITPSTRIADDMLLCAKWERNEYVVEFDTNGATEIPSLTVLHGESLGALPVLVRDGYTLEGWYTDASGENAISAFMPITAHMTLFALWTKDPPAMEAIEKAGGANYDWGDDGEDAGGVGDIADFVSGPEIAVIEGGNAEVRVAGGNVDKVSNVQVYLTYNTAAAADIDPKAGTVDGEMPKGGLKFPLTLSWAAGEIGEKVITIPVKTDKTAENAEFFTLQLANAQGMELGESRVCTVTIHDPGYDELAAKIADGTATKAEKTAWEKLQKAKAPYVRGLADPADGGKVSGSGLCAEGKKVTLKATANKGYVFAGWTTAQIPLDGDRLVIGAQDYVAKTASLVIDRTAKPAKDTATSTTLTDVDSDATFYACFITAEEDKSAIAASVDGWAMEPWVSKNETHAFATNVWAGVYLEWPVAAEALSATTVKVSGLPSGLKFTAKPVTSKVGSGKTAVVVTNVPANTIYGVPTAASKADKNGNVKPSEVKVTVTTAGKSAQAYQIDMVVEALPAWASGKFDGGSGSGQAQLTVAENGKLSGKYMEGGVAYALAAGSYSSHADGTYYADVTASWSYKDGKSTVKASDVWTLAVGEGAVGGVVESERFDAWQNLWSQKDWKDLGVQLFGKNGTTMKLAGEEYGLGEGESVELSIKANGTVAAKGVFGKAGATGSAVVCAESAEPFRGKVFVYFAPNPSKGFDGYVRVVDVGDPDGQ